jgi:hypothetical protein
MKLEAKKRLQAADEEQVLNLTIRCKGEAYKTLINFLGAVAQNCNAGHSAVVAAFFDGDGSDKLKIEGLPENDGAAMANACGDYGDGLMALIGPSSALAYSDGHDGTFTRKAVWPTKEEK